MGRHFYFEKKRTLNSSSPKWVAIFFVLAAVAALSGCGKSDEESSPMSPAVITGQWKSGGKPARIELVSDALVCINENEARSRAEIKDGKVLVAMDWNTSATLSPDGKVLRWDNDTVWIR
jgi:hypothetical protein